MNIANDFISKSMIYAKLVQKQGELAKIDKSTILQSDSSPTLPQKDEVDYQRVLNKFKNTDSQIRNHEQLHSSMTNTTTPISYKYQVGPDGKMYAVGGEVRLDTSMPQNPKEALHKLDQIQKASSVVGMSIADSSIISSANLMKQFLQIQIENQKANSEKS
jgi:hypothetical protein